jgi:hypothetical protein
MTMYQRSSGKYGINAEQIIPFQGMKAISMGIYIDAEASHFLVDSTRSSMYKPDHASIQLPDNAIRNNTWSGRMFLMPIIVTRQDFIGRPLMITLQTTSPFNIILL